VLAVQSSLCGLAVLERSATGGGPFLSRQLFLTRFNDLNLEDPFFDSLKASYEEFQDWCARKADEELYVVRDADSARLSGMLYLKREEGEVEDVVPTLSSRRWLKVGTLKIEGRGTKLGERLLKKIFDTAIAEGAEAIYVTIFDVHAELIELFGRYGFRYHGTKTTKNGTERVYVRLLNELSGDIVEDYPFIHMRNRKGWLLAIYPAYHSDLLPDSILNNEPKEILRDVSHANTIHKAYIGRVPLIQMSRGDIVVTYRTSDNQGPAFYRSVATSVCVVEEVKERQDFVNADHFIEYAAPHSVFSAEQLRTQFDKSNRLYVAKMTYNAAFRRRTTRGRLLEEARISEQPRWDLRELSADQLKAILQMGEVDARLIVD
jgi:hypothetical protein